MGVATTEEVQERIESADGCPECLAGNLGWLLTQAHFNLVSEFAAALEPLGVSNRGYHVLATARSGEYTQKGLAERKPSSTDRRARVISVTKAGERTVAQGEKIIDRIQGDVLESLPVKERKVFLESLGSLVKERLSQPAADSPPLRRREPRH